MSARKDSAVFIIFIPWRLYQHKPGQMRFCNRAGVERNFATGLSNTRDRYYLWERTGSTVEAGVWRRNFPGVLLQGHTAGTNFDLSTAVGNMQMNFDLSTGQ